MKHNYFCCEMPSSIKSLEINRLDMMVLLRYSMSFQKLAYFYLLCFFTALQRATLKNIVLVHFAELNWDTLIEQSHHNMIINIEPVG